MFCHAWNPSKIREPSYHNFRLSSMLESASVHYVECWQLWLVQLPETLGLYCTMSLLHFWCESLVGISDLLQIHRHMNVTKIIYWWGSVRLLNIFFLLSAKSALIIKRVISVFVPKILGDYVLSDMHFQLWPLELPQPSAVSEGLQFKDLLPGSTLT